MRKPRSARVYTARLRNVSISMLIKIIIVALLLIVLGSLASAAVFLIKDTGDSKRTVKALTWRIGLSVALFVLLLFAGYMGWIQPHGALPVGPR